MVAIKAIRNGLEDRLDTIDGLRIVDGANINIPAAVVVLANEGISYHRAFADGLTDIEWRIVLYVGSAYIRTDRDKLDDYLDVTGSQSIKAAIEADSTLGGTVHDLSVTQAREIDLSVRASPQGGGMEQTYLGAEIFVISHGDKRSKTNTATTTVYVAQTGLTLHTGRRIQAGQRVSGEELPKRSIGWLVDRGHIVAETSAETEES